MDTTKKFNESFEDLKYDCLVNKIRFIAIDWFNQLFEKRMFLAKHTKHRSDEFN